MNAGAFAITSLALGIPPILLMAQAAPAYGIQVNVDLDRFNVCSACQMERVLDVRMGDTAGLGIITGQLPAPVYDSGTGQYAVFSRGGSEVLLFTSAGEFLRRVGRDGRGPGELRTIARVGYRNGLLAVMNYGNLRWTFFESDGNLLREVPLEEPGEIIWFSQDSIIVGAMGTRRESAGFPLHVVDLSNGQVVRRFGTVNERYNLSDPFRTVQAEGDPTRKTVWIGTAVRLRFEEWSLGGDLLRVVAGEPSWYPRLTRAALPTGEPQTYMRDFAVDGRSRLWILSHTAGEDWRSAIDAAHRVIDAERYASARVDVYDLVENIYLGSHVFDQWEASLLLRDDEVLVSVPEIGADLNLTLALYRLAVRHSPSQVERR